MSEQELIRRCATGDPQARRALYDRTSVRIYGLLLRMTGREEDALDCAQDTYVKAFENIGRFDGRASLATWLYRIAVNEALQFLRHRQVRTRYLAGLPPPATTDPESTAPGDRMDLDDALAALDPIDRSMLLLRYQRGLSYRDIAEAVGCAAGTVGSRLNRARNRLRDLMGAPPTRGEGAPDGTHPINGTTRASGDSGPVRPDGQEA